MCKQMLTHIKKRMNRLSECILFDRSLKEFKKNVMELRLSYAWQMFTPDFMLIHWQSHWRPTVSTAPTVSESSEDVLKPGGARSNYNWWGDSDFWEELTHLWSQILCSWSHDQFKGLSYLRSWSYKKYSFFLPTWSYSKKRLRRIK